MKGGDKAVVLLSGGMDSVAGDHAIYPDCLEEFMSSMGSAIRLGTYANI